MPVFPITLISETGRTKVWRCGSADVGVSTTGRRTCSKCDVNEIVIDSSVMGVVMFDISSRSFVFAKVETVLESFEVDVGISGPYSRSW
jgi:hypothetical protein